MDVGQSAPGQRASRTGATQTDAPWDKRPRDKRPLFNVGLTVTEKTFKSVTVSEVFWAFTFHWHCDAWAIGL